MPDLGFFTRLGSPADKATAYREGLELFRRAEAAGYSSAWVAQHHLPTPVLPAGALPSPWIFLSHLAAQTERIQLATAVTVLPLEDPIRLAEDVAVLDVLSDGRVQLGLGSGLEPDTFELFGARYADKYEEYDRRLPQLIAALRGEPVGEPAHALVPAAPDVADRRLWQGAHSRESAVRVGKAGLNLLLDANAPSGDRHPGDVQSEWIDAYREVLPRGADTRIAVVRAIVPTENGDAGRLQSLFPDIDERIARARQKQSLAPLPAGTGWEEKLATQNVLFDTIDGIVSRLREDAAVTSPQTTDLIVQFAPALVDVERSARAIDAVADAVSSALSAVRSA